MPPLWFLVGAYSAVIVLMVAYGFAEGDLPAPPKGLGKFIFGLALGGTFVVCILGQLIVCTSQRALVRLEKVAPGRWRQFRYGAAFVIITIPLGLGLASGLGDAIDRFSAMGFREQVMAYLGAILAGFALSSMFVIRLLARISETGGGLEQPRSTEIYDQRHASSSNVEQT